ncbi:AraC family transcriptional regulator [Microbacterium sp. ARD32]|uniref:AraC family transcriptional regulator n=1 Tax=Microbacterium sp. ARD32 TaxID=2962577 RepID=UPI00288283D4|nr:AraC family transcriptional regulator [Microbacterium sp. ARD32]MDT0158304.1 AraC family transcriptional regulator [Microbacterium sp. ARD32]
MTVLQFSTYDASRVEETWRQFVPSAALQQVDPDDFRFDWFSAEGAGFSLVRYGLRAQVRSVVEPENQLLACSVAGPGAEVWSGRSPMKCGAPWLTDGARMEARWDQAQVSGLIFDRGTAEELARRMCGDDTLRLRVLGGAPDHQAAREHWSRSIDFIAAAMIESADDELILAGVQRQALWLLLTMFPTTFRTALEQDPQSRVAPRLVRKALAYIDENAHLPITVDDIAAAVHISTRGLQYAFRRSLDTTPAQQLRRARLEGARRELLDGTQDTIAAIARRWGFAHPSRFSAAYRDQYGVLPAATARRRE